MGAVPAAGAWHWVSSVALTGGAGGGTHPRGRQVSQARTFNRTPSPDHLLNRIVKSTPRNLPHMLGSEAGSFKQFEGVWKYRCIVFGKRRL